MTQIDPDKIRVILATDCGSTTTKAILIHPLTGMLHGGTDPRKDGMVIGY